MNELDPRDNGMPAWAGDLEFMQEAIKEAIKGLIDPGTNCVIRGCQLTRNGTNFEITEGWVYIDGEVFYVPGETVKGNAGGGASAYDASTWFDTNHHFIDGQASDHMSNFAFEVEDTWTGDGNKKFYDNTFRNTYRQRRARARYQEVAGPSPSDDDFLSIAGPTVGEIRLSDQYLEGFLGAGDQWFFIGPTAWSRKYDANIPYILTERNFNLTFSPGTSLKNGHGSYGSPYRDVQVTLNRGVVHFLGDLDDNGSSGNFLTLPGGLAPDAQVEFFIADASKTIRHLWIETNGDCIILNAGSGNRVPLDGIRFVKDAPL